MAFKYSIDDIKYKKCKEFSYIVIHGWCLSENGGSVDYKVLINHLEHSFRYLDIHEKMYFNT